MRIIISSSKLEKLCEELIDRHFLSADSIVFRARDRRLIPPFRVPPHRPLLHPIRAILESERVRKIRRYASSANSECDVLLSYVFSMLRDAMRCDAVW